MSMQLFAQIKKVDVANRLVFGVLADESIDKADEAMDYLGSKPHFQKWSADIAKDTDGKSLGNLRAMHGKVAAGKFTQINFNDTDKSIEVAAKVVDDNEWNKVLEGVYTGFSIGGSYVGASKVEKVDGKDIKRYIANPTEGSLVDRPCNPAAKFFDVQKADGKVEQVAFQAAEPEFIVNGTGDQVMALAKLMKDGNLTMADVLKKLEPEAVVEFEKMDDAAAKVYLDHALEKVEADLKDTLAKMGMRNSKGDQSRLDAIHKMTVDLGASCGDDDAAKAVAAAELKKAEEAAALAKANEPDAKLAKLVADAMAPLQKALTDATAEIEALKKQPAATTVKLRAVAKGEDVDTTPTEEKIAKALDALGAPIVDGVGEPHEAAGLIRKMHFTGGKPLHQENKR